MGNAVSRPVLDQVSAGDVLDLLQKAARVGADPAEILAGAQVPFTLADLSANAVGKLARQHLTAIYRQCIVTMGWQNSRSEHRRPMHPDEFRMLCYCIITCRTFRAAIERQIQFFHIRADRISTMALSQNGPLATLSIDTLRRRKTFGTFLLDLAGMSILCRLYGWLIGMGAHLFRVGLAYGAPFTEEPVADFFAGELTFNRPVNQISFPAHLLDMPVVRTPDELDELLQEFPFDFMAAKPTEMRLSDRIRTLYSMALTRGASLPSLEQIADLTGQSVSTVRRQLADEQISIRSLKDAARHDAAVELLRGRHRKIEDVAFRTGFRDVDSFRAAFRRWTGTSPGQYRKSLAHRPDGAVAQ